MRMGGDDMDIRELHMGRSLLAGLYQVGKVPFCHYPGITYMTTVSNN